MHCIVENSRLTGRRGRCILEISSETGYIGQFFGILQVLPVFIYSTLHCTVWPNWYALLVQYAVLKTAYHHFLTRCNMSDFWRLECDALSTRTTSNAAAEGVVELIADRRWAKMEGCQHNKAGGGPSAGNLTQTEPKWAIFPTSDRLPHGAC